MGRFFLEVSYHGANYSGFQKQHNAISIQGEIEKAFQVLQRDSVELTGSSRTDAGVHALQNYFHFDYEGEIHPQFVYKINAILPKTIVALGIRPVGDTCHSRFDAISRRYSYHVYSSKNAFLQDRAYFYPYTIDINQLNLAADILKNYADFSSFSKRNTQVKSFICSIDHSKWVYENNLLIYQVRANRFLRGMVRGLTGTMLQVGRGKVSLDELHDLIQAKDCSKAYFDVPAKGLFLEKVQFPDGYFGSPLK